VFGTPFPVSTRDDTSGKPEDLGSWDRSGRESCVCSMYLHFLKKTVYIYLFEKERECTCACTHMSKGRGIGGGRRTSQLQLCIEQSPTWGSI